MEKEQTTPFDLYQRGLRILPSSAEPRHSDGAGAHQAIGAPEGQGLEGAAPAQPLGDPSRKEAMPGLRVGGVHHGTQKGEAGGEGAQDRWEQPTHHHLLPLAFRGKVHVVGVGGQWWGSDLVQQGPLAIEQSLGGPMASEEEDCEAHCQH